jgi:molecular chaperone DnaK (HSP70)
MAEPRYVVGIDLGTTNSVVAYVDTARDDFAVDAPDVRVFPVAQLVKPGLVEEHPQLPSFLYLPAENELKPESLQLPWTKKPGPPVGAFARTRGADVPRRVVASAKSYLCAVGADPSEPILPWGAPDDVQRISAVDAQTAYLAHVRAAWDHAMDAPLARQDVSLAVPASFDAAARDLTMRAAAAAGLEHVRLVEEPQAAFYAWLAASRGAWRERVRVGEMILVCDVGGGTTDLTLVAVGEENGVLTLERVAVGDHILLGGDNMDLTLAHAVAGRLAAEGTRLDEWQLRGLVHACREAKERLLAGDGPDTAPLVVLGRSRKVIGGTVRTETTRAEVERVLVDGFFPVVDADAAPIETRRAGLAELGLRYAADPAVTRHVASFLARQREVAPDGATTVLFNGGVMKAGRFRDRMAELLSGWRPGGTAVDVLEAGDVDFAVAEGAAVHGLARRGRGVRIRGGTARAYYVGVEVAAPAVPGMAPPVRALCVAPFGMEEGSEAELAAEEFALVVGEPAAFRFFGSSVRRDDTVGTTVDQWSIAELEELGPLETTLDAAGTASGLVPVRLRTHVTDVGTLEVWCVETRGDGRWKLEFNLRSAEA